jgi:hypothetical protein
MTGKELFGALTRWTGLLLLITGVYQATGMINPAKGYSATDYMATVAVYLIGGLIFLFGADGIAWLVYRDRR